MPESQPLVRVLPVEEDSDGDDDVAADRPSG